MLSDFWLLPVRDLLICGFGFAASSPRGSPGATTSSTWMPTVSCVRYLIPPRRPSMKISVYIGGLIGLALLVGIAVHADFPAMVHV